MTPVLKDKGRVGKGGLHIDRAIGIPDEWTPHEIHAADEIAGDLPVIVDVARFRE